MKKSFLLLILVFLFIVVLQTAVYSADGELVWLVEPTLEYNYIYYCAMCNLFGPERPESGINTSGIERDTNLLNVEANLAKYKYENGSAYVSAGHGGRTDWYFYDSNKDGFLICSSGEGWWSIEYFTRDEFVNEIYWNRIIAVRETDIDLSKINGEYDPDNDELWRSLFKSHDGDKYTLMSGGRFISGFIYEDFKSRGDRYMPRDFIDVNSNGKWGIVNRNGTPTVSFSFEDIEFINDDFAFAKYNGKYGVLDLKATMQINAPATGESGIFIFVVLVIAAAILTLSKSNRFRIISN